MPIPRLCFRVYHGMERLEAQVHPHVQCGHPLELRLHWALYVQPGPTLIRERE